MATGRFAPSPTGDLHIGNLRTALLAWMFARSADSRFVLRIEDLDRVASSTQHEAKQLQDLRAIGIDWDGQMLRQSERSSIYQDKIGRLRDRGLLYPCYCSRREIREAASAQHGPFPEGAYTGTCRDLSERERERRSMESGNPAWRVRADEVSRTFTDRVCGETTAVIDDFVVQRKDGVASYNLAVVVDDGAQHVEEVVRGDDLLDSTPRHIWLGEIFGIAVPTYAHVPLVYGDDGDRLAKRHGAVTLTDLANVGVSTKQAVGMIGVSLGLAEQGEELLGPELLARFDGWDPARTARTIDVPTA